MTNIIFIQIVLLFKLFNTFYLVFYTKIELFIQKIIYVIKHYINIVHK